MWKNEMGRVKEYVRVLKNGKIGVVWGGLEEGRGKWLWWGGKDGGRLKSVWIEMLKELKEGGVEKVMWVWRRCGKDEEW